MVLEQIEKAFKVIGDKVLTAGSGKNRLDDFEIIQGNVTTQLVVKPRKAVDNGFSETRRSLNNMTKQAICDLAVERYGVDLNMRTEKKVLITEYLELQEQEI
jgi:hypothetical protein